jgi:dual specificity phosphatase 12
LRRPAVLKEAGITHIVSALRFDYKETKGWENYKQLNVHVDDTDDENIIQYFPDVVAFVTEALEEGGGVLIHW